MEETELQQIHASHEQELTTCVSQMSAEEIAKFKEEIADNEDRQVNDDLPEEEWC